MVDCEVDVPVWVILGRSDFSVGGLGPFLVPILVVLGCSLGLCWRSWGPLGAYVGGHGALLGHMLAILGRSWGLCWRFWAALRAKVCGPSVLGSYVGGLGPVLGPMLSALGRSWGLCWRSWAVLGPKLAVWAALGASEGGLGTGSRRKAAQTRKSGPNPSGSRIRKRSGPPRPPEAPRGAWSQYQFFL